MSFVCALRLVPTQRIGVSLTKLQGPLVNGLVGDDDAATVHQFLDVAKTQRKSKIKPHHVADDLGWIAEAAVNLGICHHVIFKIWRPEVS